MFGKFGSVLFLAVGAALAASAAYPVGDGKYSLGTDGQWTRKMGFSRGERTFFVSALTVDTGVQDFSVEAAYTWGGTNVTVKPSMAMETYDSRGYITGYYKLFTVGDMTNVPVAALTFTFKVTGQYTSDKKKLANNEFELCTGEGHGDYPGEVPDPPEEVIPKGTSESDPLVISPSTSVRYANCESTNEHFTGSFYLSADLTAGHKYMFGIECATNYPMSMYLRGTTNELFTSANDYSDVWTNCCAAYAVVPEKSGTYFIRVESGRGVFRLEYAATPYRTPAQHPHGEISTVSPATFVPGYLNDPESGAFDNVIDQELFAFSNYAKGDCLNFCATCTNAAETTTNLLLVVYDSKGNVLGESRRVENGRFGGRISWTATSAGSSSSPLYVGVCQELAEGEVPTAGGVKLTVSRVEVSETVTPVTAVPDAVDRSPVDCPEKVPTDARELGPVEWSNVFALPARAGITYRLKVKLAAGGRANGYALTATAYTLSGTTKKPLDAKLVTDSAAIDPAAGEWWEISPNANATVYVEVSVADGAWGSGDGLDYGPYSLCVTGKGPGNLGLLRADMGGAAQADMGWKIVSGPAGAGIVASKETYYPAGSTVILPVGGAYVVAAKSISGFKGVDSKGYDANVFVTGGGGVVNKARDFRYFDTADPLDDGPDAKAKEPTTKRAYAPVRISPTSGKAAEVCRSLWNDYEGESYRDTNDWFTVSANEGTFYRFSLPWTSDERATEVRVFGPNDWTRECEYNVFTDRKSSVRISAEKGTYYIRVANDRPGSSTNCAYKLRTLMTTPGTVKFSKNAITVKDTDAYVDITVNRTGKDGRIRVKYHTEAVEAQPGKDYYPVLESAPVTLTWENGDNKAKTVRIKLIPDIVTVPLGVTKTFRVRFETYGWNEIDEANEYVPRFDSKMGDTVTVTIAETKKQVAGTVQVEETYCAASGAAGATVKKPVFDVTAGETLEIPFERVLGTNGVVGVVAATVKGSANKSGETDYESATVTNVWGNGVGGRGPAVLRVRTKQTPSDFTAKKTFTVKLTALTSKKGDAVQYAKPSFAASSITVNILNDKYGQTAPDWSKSKDLPSGVTGVREGKGGTWFRADDGETNLYSTISRKFAGPSRLRWWNADVSVYGGEINELYVTSKGVTTTMRTEDAYTNDLLAAATPLAPTLDRAVVANGTVELCFNHAADEALRGVSNRVYLLSKGACSYDGRGRKVACKLGDAATEIRPDADGRYVASVQYTSENRGSYTWRVDSFFVGGTVTNASKTFNLAVQDGFTPVTAVKELPATVDCARGDCLKYAVDEAAQVDAGTIYMFKECKVFSGKLPDGVRVEQDKYNAKSNPTGDNRWYVRGTPTKAGAFEAMVQSTYSYTNSAGKVATVKGTTFAVKFTVAELVVAKPLAPHANKAVVASGSPADIRFAGDRSLVYRAFILEKGAYWRKMTVSGTRTNYTNVAYKLGDPDTERPVENIGDGTFRFNSVFAVGAGTNYTWQVHCASAGGTITNKSSVFSFDGAKACGSGFRKTLLVGEDAYHTAFDNNDNNTVMVLRQRLPASFWIKGDGDLDANVKKVAVVGGTGSLPAGLKVERNTYNAKSNPTGDNRWYVRGTPTKAGDFSVLVQATYTNMTQDAKGKWKSTDVPAATALMTFRVESVETLSDVSFTLAGPGRFVRDATDIRYPEGERRHTVTNWIKAGSQTLKLSDLEHVYAYSYVQLPAATPVVPLVDKATVRNGPVEFRFTHGADDAANGIAYRVYALSDGASWTNVTYDSRGREKRTTGRYKLGDAVTEIAFDGSYRTNVWYDAKVNKGKWTWRADSFFVGGTVTNGPKSAWTFTVADESKLPPGAPLAATPVRGRDAYGNEVDVAGGDRVILHRLVKADLAVGAPGSSVAKVTGTVPAGLSLKSVKGADGRAQYRLAGTPTKAGEYLLVLQETSDKVKGATTALAITVEDTGRPEGTYNGLAATDVADVSGCCRQAVAQISFSAPSSGKLSAKALIGGKTYTFTDTGYARARTNDEGRVTLEATLVQLQKVTVAGSGKAVTFTNELELAVLEAKADDESAWALDEPALTLRMRALPELTGSGYHSVTYDGTLIRDNTKVKDWVSAIAGFSGYYTVALVPDTNDFVSVLEYRPDNYPTGNGYLTMTLDAKGMAKVGGALADGASFSASLPVAFGETNGERVVRLPLYVAKNKSVLAGWIGVRFPEGRAPKDPVTGSWTEDVPVVLAYGDEGIVWANDDSGETYAGEFGYGVEIHPVGGWYDTVVNLQRHYIGGDYDHAFSVDTATVDELWQISDLIHGNVGEGYCLATNALPCGQTVDLAVNNLTVDKQALVKDSTKTYYVWDQCVNPANVTLTFKRATGILTGTCCIWYEGVNAKGAFEQKYYSNCKHAGVFLMCRDADELLPDDVVTAGALIIPQTIKLPNGSKRTWNANFRFNVRSAKRPMDWGD